MKVIIGSIKEDFSRELFWTKIIFKSNDETKSSIVYASGSREYFEKNGEKNSQEVRKSWQRKIIEKWKLLGQKIYDQDVHFDIYAVTDEGEANGLDYLLNKVKAS